MDSKGIEAQELVGQELIRNMNSFGDRLRRHEIFRREVALAALDLAMASPDLVCEDAKEYLFEDRRIIAAEIEGLKMARQDKEVVAEAL